MTDITVTTATTATHEIFDNSYYSLGHHFEFDEEPDLEEKTSVRTSFPDDQQQHQNQQQQQQQSPQHDGDVADNSEVKRAVFAEMEMKSKYRVVQRNQRERKRIKFVNQAFDELRRRVPKGKNVRKISKVGWLLLSCLKFKKIF